MKTILKFTIFFVTLMVRSATAHSQTEWFPIGAKWCYEHWIEAVGPKTRDLFTVEKDTLVDGKTCRIIRGETCNDIVFEENSRVYYYFNGKFRKIYDFNVNVGDVVEFEFKTSSASSSILDTTIILPMQIESISTRIIDGVELREVSAFYIYSDGIYYWDYKHVYLEKIGVEYPYMQIRTGIFPSHPGWASLPSSDELLWYQDHDITMGDLCDCQSPPSSTEIKIDPFDLTLFPNPVKNTLHIFGETQKVSIVLFDAMGKFVFEKKKNLPCELNVEHLLPGIYFIRIVDENTKRITTNKFVKL